ncbi:MAG: DUF2508 family protein [Clostridia bacterium]|nr:DUF2508 family protein [Clostridia bacterium]
MVETLKRWLFKPREKTDRTLQQLQDTRRQIDCVRASFDMQSDGDLIESCIYELDALQARYRFLFKQIKGEPERGDGPCRPD